jgi:malate dehydrogenase (oxaloacetate-decarboxylating)(NADP+)
MVHRGEADSMICGTFGQYLWHLNYVTQVLAGGGLRPVGALSLMIIEDGPLFIADTQVHPDPARAGGRDADRRGAPCAALRAAAEGGALFAFSSSAISTRPPAGEDARGARNPRRAEAISTTRARCMSTPRSTRNCGRGSSRVRGWSGAANVLIFANTDAASGVRNILKARARGLEVGPILMGMGNRAHIVTPSITARGLLNMSAIAGTPVAHYG